MGIQLINRELITAVPITFDLVDIYAWDLDSHTPAGLRRVIEKSELKNSFWRSRNRYRRFTSAFSESSLRTPSLVKTTDFIILVFSYLKINSLVIPYLKNIFNIPWYFQV